MQHWDTNAGVSRNDIPSTPKEVLRQTNKRLTLNLLIQGAASHAFLTAHHVVKDELEAVRPGLWRLYDRMTIGLHLNYFIGDILLLYGLPSRFWARVHRAGHPFCRHRLLATHGGELSRASKHYLVARGWRKWVIGIPVIHWVQMMFLLLRVAWAERGRKQQLSRLAKLATSRIWGIEKERLEPEFTTRVAFGHLKTPKTWIGRFTQQAVIGYGGVERRDGQFMVVAKSWNWPLVLHELVKGTAELVCLHGINTLDDETFRIVTDEADQIEYETWLLQAGPEMWRRLLAVLPHDRPLAEMLMHIARLEPEPLERLMLAVIEDPAGAKDLLDELG